MRKNAKGFTLIELLAVITIMGILMIVAIPAVTRTIENSRKDTFVNTVQNYVGGAKTMWASDNLQCGEYVSSAVATGGYYIAVNSASASVPQLLESGGKSPWGSRDILGYIYVKVYDVVAPGKDGKLNNALECDATGDPSTSGTSACKSEDDVTTRKVDYYPVMVDDIHGVNITASGVYTNDKLILSEKLKRGNLLMSGANYKIITGGASNPTDLKTATIGTPQHWIDADNDKTVDSGELTNAIECVEV